MTFSACVPATTIAPSARLPALVWAWIASWVAFVALVGSFAFSVPHSSDDLSAHLSDRDQSVLATQAALSIAETDVEAFGLEPALAAFVAVFALVLQLLARLGGSQVPAAPFVHHRRHLTVRWRTRALGSRGPPLHT